MRALLRRERVPELEIFLKGFGQHQELCYFKGVTEFSKTVFFSVMKRSRHTLSSGREEGRG